jgi:hypothetical protein
MRNDIVAKIANLLWEESGRPNGEEYRTYWLYDVGIRRMKIRDFHWWKAEWIISNRAVPDGPLWAMGGRAESQQEAEDLYLGLIKKLE